MFNLKHSKISLDNQNYKKFVNEAVIDIQNLENISPIPKPQKKIAQVEDVKRKLFNDDNDANVKKSDSTSMCILKFCFILLLILMIIALGLFVWSQIVIHGKNESNDFVKDTIENQYKVRVIVDIYGTLKDEEKYNGFELSPLGQEDQSYDTFLDIMEITAKYEDGCETAFVYGSSIYISNQCLITLWRRNYIVNAKIPHSKNTAYLQI